jgi:hypothetical protein
MILTVRAHLYPPYAKTLRTLDARISPRVFFCWRVGGMLGHGQPSKRHARP